MTAELTEQETLAAARTLVDAAQEAVATAITAAAELTDGGKAIDDHQVHAERVAQLATFARAAEELVAYCERQAAARGDAVAEAQALAFAAEVIHKLRADNEAAPELLALGASLDDAALLELMRLGISDAHVTALGANVLEARGAHATVLEDQIASMTRDQFRTFARTEIVPIAQEMHREDHLVPEELIRKMADLGLFGSSIPEEFGGTDMGLLTMVVLTEELSAASLVAGSLITRSEILTRALAQGGTDEQRQAWLPRIATGELIVGICVTEPDIGSDVASVQCKATRGELDSERGWLIDGAKAWATFAGRANILALLARTDPDEPGARGLSLFIVPKDPHLGHSFVQEQAGGGSITGNANPTPGYRGMHSFTLAFDRYFVPEANLVGGEAGLGRGFYLQMGGFAAGRLQTGGRATGVGQASLEKACQYALDRRQFDRPIAEYQLTQHKIGRMSTHVAAGRHLTYAAALEMQEDERAAVLPAMAKLFASDVAVWVSQEAQLIHGGWGYSEEDPVARYVVDALVLPIFEGVKPILELKIIARQLLAE
ncbi:MAG: acyl-CoA dehydrogenase family protein [Chloroflexi bacterium]|nr:acyl-CoA dehydrogenase family protein [Chloroflexota bacterium]